jgi:hypothetical protein
MDFVLGPPQPLTQEQIAEREAQAERVRKLADPRLLRRVARWENYRMLPEPAPLPMALKPQATHFDRLSDWYAGYLGVRGEFEPPYELSRDLKEGVPQAILRDIYRPIYEERPISLTEQDIELDPGGRRALKEAREALHRDPIPTIEPALLVVMAEQKRRRRFLKQPWVPPLPDDAPRRYSEIPFITQADDDE